MASEGFQPLEEKSLVEYIKATPSLFSKLGNELDDLQIKEVGDGNLNFVYIVSSPSGSFVAKQALPYIRCIGESWPMTKERAYFEAVTLRSMNTFQNIWQGLFSSHHVFTVLQAVAEFCGNVELCRLTEQVVFSDPYKVSPHNRWTSPYLDRDVEAVCEDNTLKLEVAELKSMAQALIHGDLHTGSVMVTSNSTQVIDPEFAFYGPMGFDIGAFVGNLILAFFAQDGHADQENDRKAYKDWILRTIDETWNLFHKKFTALWDKHEDGSGGAYLPAIYNNPQLQLLVKQKFMKDLFHDTLGFGASKMIRRIVGVAHVEDFESITDAGKRADCERRALDFAKMLMKERRKFQGIAEVVSAIHELHS
ncbi:hypothetical protein TEA_023429 [Camellia sinensis var. sinensis]|uniref:S-methyl-5-thioribose kinase n=1 Tax=Camellia sinensis var. sinensis TaxID=542762 RepID=A0A4S4CX87_CAMSN|nr:hypothetical protein TEA_023429 [Camellia sinensis var. sinensis]